MDTEEAHNIAPKGYKPNTTNESRKDILIFLSQHHKNGCFVKGATEDAIDKFGTSGLMIRRIRKRGQNRVLKSDVSYDVSSRKKRIVVG